MTDFLESPAVAPEDEAPIEPEKAIRLLEAVLLTSTEPLGLPALKRLFDDAVSSETLRNLLDVLKERWTDRGLTLVLLATGYRFQTRPDVQEKVIRLNPDKPQRYSRAVMETLAIIAYRQPVTRGDIEDIRGVVVSTQILRALEARGWIDVIGHREVPGRPELFGTTKKMLDDLGLRSLQELPPLAELEADAQALPVLEDAMESMAVAVVPDEAHLLPEKESVDEE